MTDENIPQLSVIIPAFNEEVRLHDTISKVQSFLQNQPYESETIVVNDGSTDKTADSVRQYADFSPPIRLVSYIQNRGKGYAVRQGVFAARGKYILFSDADLSTPIEETTRLLPYLTDKDYDLAIASRAVKGAKITSHQPLYRELGGKTLNLIIQMLAVPGVKDTQCGFKLFKKHVAKDIFERAIVDGWGFDVEVLYLARKMGFVACEVPVTWSHAEGSTIHPFRAACEIIADIIKMRSFNYDIGRLE